MKRFIAFAMLSPAPLFAAAGHSTDELFAYLLVMGVMLFIVLLLSLPEIIRKSGLFWLKMKKRFSPSPGQNEKSPADNGALNTVPAG